ncbi:Metalloprotease MmpA [Candidatus Entotheonellaceae bacterium PAL068K]
MQPTIATFFDYGLLFIIVLGTLIFVHEFGHFIFAKKFGVRVERFSLGFGPACWRKQWGDTEYRLSVVPLGGYVKMYGDNPGEEVDDPADSFLHQSVWKRIPIVAAGPLFNIFLAIALIAGIHVVGIPVEKSVQIGRILDGSPAAQAGLQTDDIVVALDGKPVERIHKLKSSIVASQGHTLQLQVRRADRTLTVPLTPRLDAPSQEWRIGVELRRGETVLQRSNPLLAVGRGVTGTWYIINQSVLGFGKILSGAIPASQGLAGPLGIARIIGHEASYGWRNWRNIVYITAAISVSLAIINLLPIPVLDGGHLLFFAIEIINGQPLSLRKREIAQQVGLLVVVGLVFFAFYNDIMNLFF